MAEEKVYLVALDAFALEGQYVYRGEELPEHGQIITVESTRDPGHPHTRRARVTRVVPDAELPIRASELVEPEN